MEKFPQWRFVDSNTQQLWVWHVERFESLSSRLTNTSTTDLQILQTVRRTSLSQTNLHLSLSRSRIFQSSSPPSMIIILRSIFTLSFTIGKFSLLAPNLFPECISGPQTLEYDRLLLNLSAQKSPIPKFV